MSRAALRLLAGIIKQSIVDEHERLRFVQALHKGLAEIGEEIDLEVLYWGFGLPSRFAPLSA